MKNLTSKIFKLLHRPKASSHKGQNGRLLIIAGSREYHGSLIYAVKAASRIVDLIYVLTTPENHKLIKNLKPKTAAFIPVTNLKSVLPKIDCVLIGPGLGKSVATSRLILQVLKSRIKAVFDADAITSLNTQSKKLLNENHILTPHLGEFRTAFGVMPNVKNLQAIVNRYRCTVLLKGHLNLIATPEWALIHNPAGNAGLTKGGTGDVLAGLVAAFYCNNSAYLATACGAYLNGAAGDALYKQVKFYYNSEDLLNQIPITLQHLTK